jgi:hypothetical protein
MTFVGVAAAARRCVYPLSLAVLAGLWASPCEAAGRADVSPAEAGLVVGVAAPSNETMAAEKESAPRNRRLGWTMGGQFGGAVLLSSALSFWWLSWATGGRAMEFLTEPHEDGGFEDWFLYAFDAPSTVLMSSATVSLIGVAADGGPEPASVATAILGTLIGYVVGIRVAQDPKSWKPGPDFVATKLSTPMLAVLGYWLPEIFRSPSGHADRHMELGSRGRLSLLVTGPSVVVNGSGERNLLFGRMIVSF